MVQGVLWNEEYYDLGSIKVWESYDMRCLMVWTVL